MRSRAQAFALGTAAALLLTLGSPCASVRAQEEESDEETSEVGAGPTEEATGARARSGGCPGHAVQEPGQEPSPEQRVQALLCAGFALRLANDDEDALERFMQALELSREPRILAQVALTEQALGRWPEAYAHLTEALSEEGPGDPWIQANRPLLEQSHGSILENVGPLLVEVEANGAPLEGAEIRIDGERMGSSPLAAPLYVRAGVVQLEVRRPLRVIPGSRQQPPAFERVRLLESLVAGPEGIPRIPPREQAELVFWGLAIPAMASLVVSALSGVAAAEIHRDYEACQADDEACRESARDRGIPAMHAAHATLALSALFAIGAGIVVAIEPHLFEDEEVQEDGESEDGEDSETPPSARLRLRLYPAFFPEGGGIGLRGQL